MNVKFSNRCINGSRRHDPEVITKRRIRDMFRKTSWIICISCGEEVPLRDNDAMLPLFRTRFLSRSGGARNKTTIPLQVYLRNHRVVVRKQRVSTKHKGA